MSKNVKEIIKNNSVGTIHSSYRNTINLTIDQYLLSIHPNSIIKTPMSLRMKDDGIDLEGLNFKKEDKVKIYPNKLLVGDYIFNMEKSKIWDPSLNNISINFSDDYRECYKIINKTFRIDEKENIFKDIVISFIDKEDISISKDNYIQSKLYNVLKEFILEIEEDTKKASKTILKLLGLGEGLTPAGDDFIMGLMSVFTVFKNDISFIDKLLKEIKKELKHYRDKTTFLSSELFYYVLKDNYSSIFLDIYKSIKNKNLKNLCQNLIKLTEMGNSSGDDTLSGIVFGLDIIKSIETKEIF